MSEQEPPLENTDDEDAKLYVADPDDYAKTRKLKAINDAKDHVRKLRNNRPETATPKEWRARRARLGEAIASYGHELQPLLNQGLEAGTLQEEDFQVKDDFDVRHLVASDGIAPRDAHENDSDVPPRPLLMAAYRQLQTLERKLGIGLQLEPEQNDEWEIET